MKILLPGKGGRVGRERQRARAPKVAPDAVRPVPTRDHPCAAARPLNAHLDTRRLQRCFCLVLPPWQLGMERMLGEVPGQ